ncbi:hypothetical protein BD289DRAFT_434211 [Coniella lustricola]|uniref:Secreted protein n=1 Tax=Coniella lustricola TaxID=2025994 RepID=A0A2T3A7U9_9PEZI|nr:hypothetical protein BD289DRAFT_434211 [Coniella lustricola]
MQPQDLWLFTLRLLLVSLHHHRPATPFPPSTPVSSLNNIRRPDLKSRYVQSQYTSSPNTASSEREK